jgi:hypothetical protein
MHRIAADMLKERLEMEDLHGSDWPGKPVNLIVNKQFHYIDGLYFNQNDMTSWLIDKAPPALRTVEDVVARLLTVNFSGIHTTSLVRQSFVSLAFTSPLNSDVELYSCIVSSRC